MLGAGLMKHVADLIEQPGIAFDGPVTPIHPDNVLLVFVTVGYPPGIIDRCFFSLEGTPGGQERDIHTKAPCLVDDVVGTIPEGFIGIADIAMMKWTVIVGIWGVPGKTVAHDRHRLDEREPLASAFL